MKNRKLKFVLILLASTIGGGILGFLGAYFGIEKIDLGITQDMVHSVLSPLAKISAIISLLIGLSLFYSGKKEYKLYEEYENDDDSEELYRSLNRKHAKTSIFLGMASIFAIFGIFSSLSIFFQSDGTIMTVPFLDFIILMITQFVFVRLMKFYGKIRGIEVPNNLTLKELKNNILQMDEAELEVNYKLSFDIVMNINGIILPLIYVGLLLLSIFTKRVELTGIAVAAIIQLYIIVMQFKMVKDYYK